MEFTNLARYMAKVCETDFRYKDLDKVVLAIARAAVEIQHTIRTASLEGAIGATGTTNIQGEAVQFLDTSSSDAFVKTMTQCGHVSAIGCEEIKEAVIVGPHVPNSYIVQMDPLDGSSNIDVDISIGSIFGIWQDDADHKLLRPGREQIAALYTLYGPSTLLVIALENTVQGFTLNPASGKFELTHPDIQLPKSNNYYSINEGNFYRFDQATQNAVLQLKRKCSLRYVGSLVADFHRNLLKGGVFLYPKDSEHPNGKLRLMYEANPLSFIIEQAGGISSSGSQRILDIQPGSLHQRTPLLIGNKSAVNETLECLHEGDQGA